VRSCGSLWVSGSISAYRMAKSAPNNSSKVQNRYRPLLLAECSRRAEWDHMHDRGTPKKVYSQTKLTLAFTTLFDLVTFQYRRTFCGKPFASLPLGFRSHGHTYTAFRKATALLLPPSLLGRSPAWRNLSWYLDGGDETPESADGDTIAFRAFTPATAWYVANVTRLWLDTSHLLYLQYLDPHFFFLTTIT
jgi:hypothetical protein